jgi:integrase
MARRTPILTQLRVDKAKVTGRRYELPDGPAGVPGFRLRVGETGHKSYALVYRVKGSQRQVRHTLGSAAVLSLAEARKRARQLVDQAGQGIDPQADKAERRARAQNTVRAVVEEYLDRHVRRNLRSARWTELRLKRDVVAAWGDRPVTSITRADVVRLIDQVHDRAPVSANRTLQVLKACLNWCLKRSILEANVAAGVDLPHRERSRERMLTDDEIRALWPAFERMAYPSGTLGQLLLLLGQRRAETAAMRWDCVDLERATWRIPSEQAKTGGEHLVPLPELALEILAAMPRNDGSPLVFPGRDGIDRPVAGFSRMLARAHQLSSTSGWSLHDLRRTMRSKLGELGVRSEIAERLLGHVVGKKVERTYDRYRYEPELRDALARWAAELARIVAVDEAKIVALAGRRA